MTKIMDMNNDQLTEVLLSFPEDYDLVCPEGNTFAKVLVVLKDNKYHHTEIKCRDLLGSVWYATERDIEDFIHIDLVSDMITCVE